MQFWEILKNINCHSVNVIYYLKCTTCNEKETYIGKAIDDSVKDFKVQIKKLGNFTSKFRRHVSKICFFLWY